MQTLYTSKNFLKNEDLTEVHILEYIFTICVDVVFKAALISILIWTIHQMNTC